ncbi:protein kinase [Nannochloropsis oceanica]
MRKVWIAEQETAAREQREKEAAEALGKELEAQHFAEMAKSKMCSMTMLATDIEKNKTAKGSIAFLYAKPPGMLLQGQDGVGGEEGGQGGLEDGADEAARAFFKQNEEAAKARKVREHKESAAFSMHGKLSALEQMTGTRRRKELTMDEQAERFPILRNAPVEGAYAQNVKLTFNPVGFTIRNCQCLKCGAYGHTSGDRECPLWGEITSLNAARLRREDPLTYMEKDEEEGGPEGGKEGGKKEKVVLRLAALPREMAFARGEGGGGRGRGGGGGGEGNQEVVLEEEGEGGWDRGGRGGRGGGFDEMDEEYLAKLSTKEKKLLLKRLRQGVVREGGSVVDKEEEREEEEEEDRRKRKRRRKEKRKEKKRRKKQKEKKQMGGSSKRKSSSRRRNSSRSSSSSSSTSSSTSSSSTHKKKWKSARCLPRTHCRKEREGGREGGRSD